MRNKLLSILISVLISGIVASAQTTDLGSVNGISISKQELQREMMRYRAEVYNSVELLRKKALDSLSLIKVQEKLLIQRNLWPYKNYQDFLKDLEDTNASRKKIVENKQVIYGPVSYDEQTFFDYRFSNALIQLKQMLVDEGLIPTTINDLQKQFEKMQQTVYKEEKYTLKGYERQVKEAFVEDSYTSMVKKLATNANRMINAKQFNQITLLSSFTPSTLSAQTTITSTVYVNSETGNDNNDGLSERSAWQTLNKVNTLTFGPGTRILLKAGSRWTGELCPKGSGSQKQPIVIDQYGIGPKPLIDGNGMEGKGVLSLYNQEYWEISNLEIVNDAKVPGDRRGVEIKAANYGTINHIHLKNLHIHHIKGMIGNGHKEKRTAGIYITTVADKVKSTRYNDILIENCHIHHIQNQGIATSHETGVFDYPEGDQWENRKITNLIIRNNTIHHISKNAMIIRMTEGGVVEHNLCYETATDITGNTIFSRTVSGTVFQYNEGFLNRSPDADGSLYDPDINSPGTVWQYSYSHDNAHGLVWFCTHKRDDNIKVRYNLSQNDKGALVYFNYAFSGAEVYNNVFYIGAHVSPVIIREKANNSHTYGFYNNIIYNKSEQATYGLASSGKGIQNRTISNNLFYGFHPDGEPEDKAKLIIDPLFVNPGTGSIGLNTLDGYKLRAHSPALNSGKVMPNNGGLDFFGNKVNEKDKPNRGMYNGNFF